MVHRFYPQGEQINGTSYYYTRDHLGSIRELVDSTGAVRAEYDYGVWGQRTMLSGDLDARFGFTGHYYHARSGLDLTLYRAYDPSLGRWLSRDPLDNAEISQGPNLYVYGSNDPIVATDPLGTDIRIESTNQVGGLHWRISVDTPTGPYGQSYGMQDRSMPMQGSSAAYGEEPSVGGSGSGIVYPDSDPTRSVIATFRTSPAEDAMAYAMLTTELNQTGPYNVVTRSCRNYSRERYDQITGDIQRQRVNNFFNRVKEWILNLF
jgi:RHS repeat-associated protein